MRFVFGLLFCIFNLVVFGQHDVLQRAVSKMEVDSQFRHASIGLVIKEAQTGKIIFSKNPDLGLIPASSLKVVTSATSFELLESSFRFPTIISIAGDLNEEDNVLIIDGRGDPTLGSERWDTTRAENIFNKIWITLKKNKVSSLKGGLVLKDINFGYQPTPPGWVWEDIGNYYGAGCWSLNWKENMYEIDLEPGRNEEDGTKIIGTRPSWMNDYLINFVKTGKPGIGDKSIVYSAPYQQQAFITGKIAPGKMITVKAAMPSPALFMGKELKTFLESKGIQVGEVLVSSALLHDKRPYAELKDKVLDTLWSPPFTSMNHWFMNKSINLYGEAFIKSMAFLKGKEATNEQAVNIIKAFWNQKGILPDALNISDGSGLSPANRVTADVLVKILEYAQKRNWYNSFYEALPEMNGMKLKSGYMNGVRSYTGIITGKGGRSYLVAFIVNNFYGSATTVREKMWRVLDVLK